MGDLAPGGSVVGLHGGVADLAQAEGCCGGLVLSDPAVEALNVLNVQISPC